MGGILIIFSIVVSVFLWQDIRNLFTWVSLFSVIGFGLIGFFDDYLKVYKKNSAGLQAKVKFIAQILLSTVIVTFIYVNRTDTSTLLYIPFFKYPVIDLSFFYIPSGVPLLLVGTSNAVNLTDGLDGLAIGLVLMRRDCICNTYLSFRKG